MEEGYEEIRNELQDEVEGAEYDCCLQAKVNSLKVSSLEFLVSVGGFGFEMSFLSVAGNYFQFIQRLDDGGISGKNRNQNKYQSNQKVLVPVLNM